MGPPEAGPARIEGEVLRAGRTLRTAGGRSFQNDRVGIRFHPDHAGFISGEQHGRGELGGWMRFCDGRPPDPLAMLLFTDAHPIFNALDVSVGWPPTIELTAHVHKRPRSGWIGGWFETRHINGGFLEEDGLVWDGDGDLVAVSRQIAMLPRSD